MLTSLKVVKDEDKWKINELPHIPEYDRELHSEACVHATKMIAEVDLEHVVHQCTAPEIFRHYIKK